MCPSGYPATPMDKSLLAFINSISSFAYLKSVHTGALSAGKSPRRARMQSTLLFSKIFI